MKIKRRFPNFFTGFEETEHEVNTLEELMAIDWIASQKDNPDYFGIFCSPSEYSDIPDALMVMGNNGNKPTRIYFVIGYIFGSGKSLGLKNYLDYVEK